ncbi:uncharacterized protein LOC107217756 isoform X2 [Neodiprion lecontei]|uniref:Uncharacterized protein LOC107217756 isoform X2 n=1 Tax=Neodiprion lecontei TaxID=441921 RepID=A0ABM3GJA2_NEOLC|nr:uncharacterized protein LOC107217756 isoform X2 [Neodiprion lecontei]
MTLKMDLASKCTWAYTPARFSARGIFITDNGYSCLICNIKIVNLVDSIKHVSKKKHCDKLHDMRIACVKVEGFVRCDICTNYVTENWKDFLIHFNQENHFQSVKGNDNQHISYVSNVTLVNNYLIEQDPGYFFCLFCNALIIGDDSVFTHIREKKHVELLTTFTEKYPPEILFEAECRKWAKNFIYKLVQSEFYCTLCNNSIKGRRNCTKHITSDNHITKMVTSENIERQLFDNCIKRKQMLDSYGCPGFGTSKDPLDDAKAMCAANLMLQRTCTSQKFSARGTEQISSSIRVENMLTKDDLNYEPLCNEIKGKKKPGTTEVAYLQLSKNLLSESFDKTICENSITGPVPLTGHFICELCSCRIASRETVYEHISGHRHRRLRKKVDSMKSQEITNVYETFQDLSSSRESTESSLANWEVCETQSQGSNLFENSSSFWESCDKISNSWETISTSSSYSAQQASMMYEIPDAFMPLISENLLERRKGELYCVACEAHLRNLDSFLGHTNSKRHNARLKIYKTQISQKNNKLLATLQNNVCSNVHERSLDYKSFEYAKRVVDKPVSRPSKLLEVPQDLIPLISKHLLNHLEKEIYCKACDAHLLTPISLINHTMSKNHIARLSIYRDQIAQSSKKSSSSTSEDSRAPNTAVHPVNKKPLQSVSKNLAKAESQRSTKLLDIPKSLVSLITKHLLDHREKELYCKACDAHLLTPTSLIDHTTSKNHIARLSIYRDQIAQSSRKSSSSTSEDSRAPNTAVHPVNKKPLQSVSKNLAKAESQRSTKLLDVPNSLVSLITKHLLDHREKELYCKACDAHLLTPTSLIDHTTSKNHIARLSIYRDQIAQSSKKSSSSTSEDSRAPNTAVHPVNKKPLQSVSKNLAKAESQRSTKLLDVPKSLVSLITKHSLDHWEKELYCKACKVHLQSPSSIIAHTGSKYHISTLKYYRDQVWRKNETLLSTSEYSNTTNASGPIISKDPLQSVLRSSEKPATVTSKNAIDVYRKVCKTHIETPEAMENNIKSEQHMENFESGNVQEKKKELYVNEMPSTSFGNSINKIKLPDSQSDIICKVNVQAEDSLSAEETLLTTLVTEKFSNLMCQDNKYSNAVTTKSEQPHSSLFDILAILIPLIRTHNLQPKENEVYCAACDFHITCSATLLDHTQSPSHNSKMQLFQVDNSNKNYEKQIPDALKESEKLKHIIQSKIPPDIKNNTTASKTKKVRVRNKKKSNKSNRESQILEVKCNLSWQETVVKNSKFLDNLREAGQNQVENPINHSKVFKKGRRKKAVPKYLHADMQHIYSMNPEKLRIIKLSCQLCFPKTSSVIYCLICQRSIPCKLQTFYEHICSLTHTANLAEMETNDQHFINCPDQFSDLTLAKELSQEISDENVQCFACDLSIQNDHADIIKHVTQDFHQERKQSWNIVMDKILQDILVQMKSTWYNIQKYWCQLCDIQFNTEFFFTEHLEGKKHQKCLKKTGIFVNRLIYDACISCATLWLGFPALYAQHCEQPLHKYLVQHGDYAKCVLPNQAKALLENAEAEVISLIALSDQVLNVQKTKVNSLLKCLEDTVKVKFPEAKAYPFGSRVSGLGFPESDIDVFLDCGTYDGKKTSKTYQIDIISSVENCLRVNEESWEIDEILVSTRTPIIKLHHRNTELSCDVSFTSGLSVENTKLLKLGNWNLCDI